MICTSVAFRTRASARMSAMSGASLLPNQRRPALKVPDRRLIDMLDVPAIVGPVQECLPLAGVAIEVPGLAFVPDLGDMPLHLAPAPDLPLIVQGAPAEVVAAVPLEPTARVVGVDPALLPPLLQRLRRVDAEEIELRILPGGRQPCLPEPARRKFVTAVRHVLPAEDAHLE